MLLACCYSLQHASNMHFVQVTEKTFQEMYVNVGMANCEKRPKQERDDIRFTHIAIPTSFCTIEVRVLLQHVLISYTGGVCCGCWKQASARWQSSES